MAKKKSKLRQAYEKLVGAATKSASSKTTNKKSSAKTATATKKTATTEVGKGAQNAKKAAKKANKTAYRKTETNRAKTYVQQGTSAATKATKTTPTVKQQSATPKTDAVRKRNGVVISESTARKTRQEAAKKAQQKYKETLKIQEEKKNETKKTDETKKINAYKKAIEAGKNRSALGTKVKEHKEEYHDVKTGVKREQLKGAADVAIIGESVKEVAKERKKLKKQGVTDEQLDSKEVQRDINRNIQKAVDEKNKELDKAMPSKLEYSYKDLTQQEYNKLATAAQTGQLDTLLKSDKDLAKKVADLNVRDYVKGAFGQGALDQMTQGLSVSQNPVYNYSDNQKQIIERQKETGAYKAGRFVGAAAEFGLGGTGTLGSAIAKTTGKKALVEAAKGGGKNLAKSAGKNIAKETAGDVFASLPLNTLDALKASYKDGKFDKDEFVKELALNVGGDILIGGVVSGITHGLSGVQVKNFNRINKTLQSGGTVSENEMRFYNRHKDELADKVESAIEGMDAQVTAAEKTGAGTVGEEIKKTANANAQVQRPETVSERPFSTENTSSSADNASNSAENVNAKMVDISGEPVVDGDIDIQATSPLINRDMKGVGNKKVNAYMYENPEVKPYFQEEARYMLTDLENSIKGERGYTDNDGVWEHGEGKWFGTKRDVEGNIAELLDDYNYSYEDIKKGLKAIIEDNGAENNAVSKRIEFALDRRLREGYDDFLTGEPIPPNQHYIDMLAEKQVTEYNSNPELLAATVRNELGENATVTAKQEIDKVYTGAVEAALNNPGKQYDTAAERIKGDNPNPKEFMERSQRISPEEVPRARQTAIKMTNQAEDDVADIMEPWIKEGLMNKKVLQTQEKAVAQAEKELADGRLYQNFMGSKVEGDEHLFMARAKVIMEDLMKKAPDSDEAAEMLLNVMDKATEASSHAGRMLNATKLLLRNTPEGRARIIGKEIERLNERFAPRMKGKKLTLSAEQARRIMEATDDTIEEVADKINREIWEDIPATWFEKFNEMRHMSMLFNPKTHIRNVVGNTAFKAARDMSDAMEVAAYKIPAVRKKLESFGGKTEMVRVSRKDVSEHKEVLDEIFNANYGKSNSKNQYVESTRPDGVPVVKNGLINKGVQTNYGLLEKEDMLMFKPEYKKNFVRWCKANGVQLDDIPNMTKEQMQKADAYALKRAEYATFRDNSAFASKIVGLKQKTAGAKGKTVLGTAAYRAGNVMLESNLPFVKTPVNILRRSVDFSPLGLGRSMIELGTAKSADDFMQGVHHLATGLTGTGVFALGILLANNDLITVKAGEESGDAYYDRDMGYQDYALLINAGGKQYSVTIDWLAPMQTSLFMGAAAYNNLSEEGLTAQAMFDTLATVMGPMLDMSFMSSSKDTIETFMEKVYRNGTGDDADWTGAVAQTLFGSVPQGYLNSFVPQFLSQTAQAFDSKQRDTRSTKDDPIAASWDSWGKKIINKIPVLRNKVLNPKLDRFGDDKVTGNNIVIRFLNAYINPSNVKQINTTKLDKEIIKIYNHIDDEDTKKYFYYNFTGNPSYDLGDGKRMTYDEAYKYGKSKRREQTALIEDMTNSKRYENMPWSMKADEVNDAHWISQTSADLVTYGSDFATERIIADSETDKEAYAKFARMGGNNADFVGFYLEKEKIVAQCHDTSYYTKAIAAVYYGNETAAKAYGIYGDKLDIANEYFDRGGSVKEYSNAMCNVISTVTENDASPNMSNKAVAAAYHKINRRTYKAMGFTEDQANMGVGLKKYGYDFDKLAAMETEALIGFDSDSNNSLKKEEVIDYVESLGLDSNEEKSCVFRYFSSASNPYGDVPDYLNFGGASSGNSGGRKGSGGRSGGSGKDDEEDEFDLTWDEYLKEYLGREKSSKTSSSTSSASSSTSATYSKPTTVKHRTVTPSTTYKAKSVTFKDWDSPLEQAYRTRISQLLKKRGF